MTIFMVFLSFLLNLVDYSAKALIVAAVGTWLIGVAKRK